MYYYRPMMEANYGWDIFTTIFWIVVLGLVIYAVFKFLNSQSQTSDKSDPLNIAKERYAKGEITKQQFEQLKKNLV